MAADSISADIRQLQEDIEFLKDTLKGQHKDDSCELV